MKKKSDHAGVIAGSVVAGVVVLAAGGVGAWIVLRKRKRARDAGSQGLGFRKAGMKYSEMPDSELDSLDGRKETDARARENSEPVSLDGRTEEANARVQQNVELDSRQRHEMLDDNTPVVRHELAT